MLSFSVMVLFMWVARLSPLIISSVLAYKSMPGSVIAFLLILVVIASAIWYVRGEKWARWWNIVMYIVLMPFLGIGLFFVYGMFMFTRMMREILYIPLLLGLLVLIAVFLDMGILVLLFRENNKNKIK